MIVGDKNRVIANGVEIVKIPKDSYYRSSYVVPSASSSRITKLLGLVA